jgi:hypothetical protein
MPFVKGKSGNPNGRQPKPRELKEVEALAKTHGLVAIKRIKALIKSKDGRIALAASQAMLDRGFGKPNQALTGADGGPLSVVIRKFV